MKVVISKAFGGFGVSRKACERMAELGSEIARQALAEFDALPKNDPLRVLATDTFLSRSAARTDPLLVRVVEEMGPAASGRYAKLVVVEIPDGVEWEIEEYDGNEWVAEKHRTWA